MEPVLVSIIMPLFNCERYVEAAIESVLSQDYSPLELIIVDDGSNDGSLAIAERFSSDRVRVYSQLNKGACVARNKALNEARGEYVKFLDADDVLAPGSVKLQVEQIMKFEDYQIPFGDYDFIDADGQFQHDYLFTSGERLSEDQEYYFFHNTDILISSPLHRKNRLLAVGGFDETFKRGHEADLHFRLALSGVEFVYSPCKTFSYRSHTSPEKITNKSKCGMIDMSAYWEKRNTKCERLLHDKYDEIPDKYVGYFSKYWLDVAREFFSKSDIDNGMAYLNKVKTYPNLSGFVLWYTRIGKVLGYIPLERLLRARLRLLGKS